MAKDIPQWAVYRAKELAGNPCFYTAEAARCVETYTQAFAKYISAHEKGPVSKYLLQARKLWASVVSAKEDKDHILSGKRDGHSEMRAILLALKLGMED